MDLARANGLNPYSRKRFRLQNYLEFSLAFAWFYGETPINFLKEYLAENKAVCEYSLYSREDARTRILNLSNSILKPRFDYLGNKA